MCHKVLQLAAVWLILVHFPSYRVSAHQCSLAYSDAACLKDVSLDRLIHQESISSDHQYYHIVVCSCAHKAKKWNYEYFAVVKFHSQDKMACYGIYTSRYPLSRRRRRIGNSINLSRCDRVCDEMGCVIVGSGRFSSIYRAISLPTTIILPTKTTHIVMSSISPPTTRKLIRPYSPFREKNEIDVR